MRSFQRLYEEMQLGERADLTARLVSTVANVMGSFRRRLPAHELTTPEFMQIFMPGRFETVHDFLQSHAARPAPWKGIPPNLVPEDIVDAANHIVDRKFSFLGCDFHFRENIDWHHSLGPGGPWPRAHWSEIQFRGISHLGDIRPCWEMNRHQFFVWLALAWHKTGDTKYPKAVTRFLHSWCDQNTPETGVNYISGIEIGLRCISWLLADRLLKGSPDWDEAAQERMHRNIFSQAQHISEYLVYTEKMSGNNHLLGEAASLAWIALQYPEWLDSERWLKRALNVLWPALDAQVFPDGMHFEASPGYQLLVVEFLALVFTELRRQKLPLPSKSYAILEKMTAALRTLQQPDGELPNINDNDNGCAIPLPLPAARRLEGVMSVMCALYNRPDFKSSAGKAFPLYGHLLLGEQGAEEFRIVAEYPEKFPFVTELRNGGLHILQRNSDWLLLKNNPDPFPQSGHNHADLLNVLLQFDGRPVLVDAGTYRFSDERGLRNTLRATAAHNTVTVDRRNQADPVRNFDWNGTVKPGFTQSHEEDGFAITDAQHDSYHRIGITHRRIVLWLKQEDAILIIDRLQGRNTHAMDQYWHFAPGTRVEEINPSLYRLSTAGRPLAWVRFLRDKDLDRHEIVAGSEGNPSFMFSRRYGEVEPGVALRHSWISSLSATHASHRIALFSKKELPVEFGDVWPGEFLFNGWAIDLSHTPAKVGRAKMPVVEG
ncbi:MAG: alginate lyase family protein [Alphaproteobacteria bacterium]|nr:MAG: alginate lyase family protein [Alphaproteobacteria bacterium]